MMLFAELLLLLALTRVLGEMAERIGQPAPVGELIAGILLAAAVGIPGLLGSFSDQLVNSEAVSFVAKAGVFFLVLMAGLEMKLSEMTEHSRVSFAVALGGVIVPLLTGIGVAWLFLPDSTLKQAQAMLVGVALAITAVPVIVRVLDTLQLLHRTVGKTVMAAAVFDDILGLFLLAILTALIDTGHVPDIATVTILLAKVSVFFAVTVGLGTHVYPRLSPHVKAMQAAALEFSALMGIAFAYALFAEALGMHWLVGVFMAGLYFEPERTGRLAFREMRVMISGITNGLLGPIFFASVGMAVDLSAVTAVPGFLASLIVFAFLSKVVGAGLPAMLGGMGKRAALAVGIGMCARGGVMLIVLDIAKNAGIFGTPDISNAITDNLYSALVLVAVVTTFGTPLLLRAFKSRRKGSRARVNRTKNVETRGPSSTSV